MEVTTIMHPGAATATAATTVTALAEQMREEDIGVIPIAEDGKPIGIVTDRDIALRAVAADKTSSTLTAGDIMTNEVVTCRPEQPIEDALEIMDEAHVRRLPVVNGAGELVGMLGLGDIASALPRDISGDLLRSVAAHHD